MIMDPSRSNLPLNLVADNQLESAFEKIQLMRKALICELEELVAVLETEEIESDETGKSQTIHSQHEIIRCFIGNLYKYPNLHVCDISDLVFEVKSVVDDLLDDTECLNFDESDNLDRECFLRHLYRVGNIVNKINSVEKARFMGSLSEEDSCSSYNYNVNGEAVFGFEIERRHLRNRLTSETEKSEVITIIGMAGTGKTTLAHMLYNHPYILQQFQIRAWICLSKSYEKKNVLEAILRCIVSEDDPIFLMSVDKMGEKVYNCLSENRYLIVIDDIWDVQAWNDLRDYFPETISASKILMTTRFENLDFNVEVITTHYFIGLTQDRSWDLFKRKLFGDDYIPEGLGKIGKKIVAKCRRLPLLIVSVARFLSKEEKTEKYWTEVSKNMSTIVKKIMDSPYSDLNLKKMIVDHQFITRINRAIDFELDDLELLLHHEPSLFSKRDEMLSLVQDLKFIYSFTKNVQETTTFQTPNILDFVLEIKYVIEDLLDETDSYICFRYSDKACFLRHCQNVSDMVHKIKCLKKDTFNSQGNAKTSHEALSIQEACSISILEEKTVIGFEDQQKELLDRLIGGWKRLEVIAIIGMAGIGKTTLANMLYNHLTILCHFHVRAWTTLSQSCRKKNLLRDILSSILCEDDPILFMSEDDMGEKLYKTLIGNKYLIVIDDIWDTEAWNDVEMYFPNNENGSRILMTSRIEDVVLHIRTNSFMYYLPFLNEDKSWDLFQFKVFGNLNIPGELKEIGKRIVTKCKGLPFAIVVIAGLLSKEKKTEQWWRHVGENMGSSMNNDLKQLMDILALSYKHLPSSLKSCFLYLGLFPEDSEIPVSTLIRSWIAEGFIQQIENKTLEDVAQDILLNLVSRNLVMVAKKSTNGGIKSICIHDIMRDMCLQMDGEKSFVHLVCGCASNTSLFYSKVLERRMVDSFSSCHYFHFYKSNYAFEGEISSTEVLSVYKYLQVLDLRHIILFNIPRRILGLLHLKFLALQVDSIKELPSSIFDLWNLETFILEGEKGVKVELEPSLLKLKNLRHFQISQELFCDEVKWMKALLEKSLYPLRKSEKHNPAMTILDKLQTFSSLRPSVFLADILLPRIQSLRKLGLHLTLSETAKDVLFPDLSGLIFLEKLNFEYQTLGMVNFSIPDLRLFPPSLKKLTLIGCHCQWSEISILGMLQNLQVLKLKDNSFSGSCWETCDDEFPQLKYLKLSHMDLQHWISSSSHFPKLQHLVLNACFDLEQIPLDIGDILTLQTIEVYRSSDSVVESAKQILENQNSIGNEYLKVFIYQHFQEF